MKIIEAIMDKGLTNIKLKDQRGVVIHWVANPNTSALRNRNYWENILANGIGAQYIIDLNGDVYHTVPDDMMGYQVGCPRGYTKAAVSRLGSYPNNCVVGIECTHVDWNGKMTDETYSSLVQLSAKLLKKFGLGVDDLWLHSEIVGKDYKDCHRWFTTTKPSDWPKFKAEVASLLNAKPSPAPTPEPSEGTHIVTNGETLWSISQKFGVTVEDLEKWNPKVEAEALQIGQKIIVKKPASKPVPKPAAPKKEYVDLPKSEDSWRAYPLNKAPKAGNEIGKLNPKKFDGLTYEVLGHPQADVVTIKTSNFGKVNIYVAKSTGAKLYKK